jgi:molybdopterin-guanine dinucleotide biosynthesis protein A
VGAGPAGGITAALLAHPQVAWLVVACDLPLLTPATLHDLIGRRDPQRLATAYRSSHDGLPEPLCAIWEPAAREPLLAYLQARAAAGKKSCPRKFLIDSDIRLLELPQGDALDNVNTPVEHDMTRERLRAARLTAPDDGPRSGGTPAASGSVPDAPPDSSARGATRTLRVQYYAILREQAGRSEETLDTAASTPTELFEELRRRHPFRLSPGQLKVALNAEFRDWDTPLQHGDTVVFIPPVAGG